MLNTRAISAALQSQKSHFTHVLKSGRFLGTLALNREQHHVSIFKCNTGNRPYSSLVNTYNEVQSKPFQIRNNFSYAGPRKLSDILKVEQIKDKSKVEVSDIWMAYHEGKEKVHGMILDGSVGKSVLARAAQA
eukprot:scaffold18576_cov51-Cyclotella_meneghiniana.AAC.5